MNSVAPDDVTLNARFTISGEHRKIDEKVVGHSGQGSALTVKVIKVDRQVAADQIKHVNLTKPLVPVRVAELP